MTQEQNSNVVETKAEEVKTPEATTKKYEQTEVDAIVNSAKQRLIEKHSKELEDFIKKSDYETLNKEYKTFKIKQEFVNTFGGKEEAFNLFLEKNNELLTEQNPTDKIRSIKDQYSYMFNTNTTNVNTSIKNDKVEYIQGTNIRKY